MKIIEVEHNFFNINGTTYYLYGRNLLKEEVPTNNNLLLLLDPLFVNIFYKNMMKILSSNNKYNIAICFFQTNNSISKVIEDYFYDLERLFEKIVNSNCNIEFISDSITYIEYLDGQSYTFNSVDIDLIKKFENKYYEYLIEEKN